MTAGNHVVLVGLMGTGKSTVGTALAAAMDRPFVDNDEQLEATTGRTAAEIQAEDGRDVLHAAELDVARRNLASEEPAVVATAASVVDTEEGRALLAENACVVWLRARYEDVADTHLRKSHRPPPPADADERDERYAEVATVTVDHEAPVEEIVSLVLGVCG